MDHPIDQPFNEPNEPAQPFPTWSQMLILFLIILVSTIVGVAVLAGISAAQGVDLTEVLSGLDENSGPGTRNLVRSSILINHLTMFVIPGILFGYILFKSRWKEVLRLDRLPNITNWFGGFLLLLVSFPLIQFSFYANKEWIPLPEWATTMEDNTAQMLEGMLAADSGFEFMFNVLVIAIIPAIGEEIIFRGWLQGKMQRSFNSPVVAIWLTAILFSAFHAQFEGFIPRMLLGALLGYLFYWTNNLWVPIIAHFLNNFIQVVLQYLYSKEISELDINEIESVPVWQAAISLALVIAIGKYLWDYNKNKGLPANTI